MVNKDLERTILDFITLLKPFAGLRETISSDSIPQPFFSFHLLERCYSRLISLKLLTSSDVSQADFALNLLYRNILSDFFYTNYVFLNTSPDEQRYRISRILNSDINQSQKDGWTKFNFVNDEDLLILKEKIQFTDKGCPNIDQIIQGYVGTKYFNRFEEAYHYYRGLSKFEHIGWTSFSTTRISRFSIEYEKEVYLFLRYSLDIIFLSTNRLEFDKIDESLFLNLLLELIERIDLKLEIV